MDAIRTGARVRAPRFGPGDWFGSPPLTLADLRGRFVLLDFWTSCCANCLHVLDELRPLEQSHAELLTVIGVHSPKFPHEAEPDAVATAVRRYGVAHPVLSDPRLELWRQYAVRAWPTLVLIDPEGYVLAQAAGEGQVSALAAVLDSVAPEYDARGTLRRGPADPSPTPGVGPVAARHAEQRAAAGPTLSFPGGAILLPAARTGRAADSLLVADAGAHRLTETTPDGSTVLRRIGSGTRGDPFSEPNGLALLPDAVAAAVGYDVLVADTAAHVLRGVRLADGAVVATVDLPAALRDARTVTGAVPPVLSPWDVAWWPALGRAVVAAAGVHLLLSLDPVTGTVAVLAGTTVEGLRDGPALDAWLAQPSGLAVDGERLWFVDAESSALRYLTLDGQVRTAVGEGLFDFGHVDGPAATARLQHPLGVAVLDDASIAVADTYNGAIRRYDERAGELQTLADGLAEPSGVLVVDQQLVVVESAAHRLTRPVPAVRTVPGEPLHLQRAATRLAAGAVTLRIAFTPAPGRTADERYGPSTRVSVTASPPALLLDGAGDGVPLTRALRLAPGDGVLHVTAQAASCDADPGTEHPACYLARQDWGIPVRVRDDGERVLDLALLA